MIKREAQFQTIFNKYLRATGLRGVFELKYSKTDRFNLSEIREHQIEGLLSVEKNGFVWKLSDADPREKPFDVLSIPKTKAYIVIKFKDRFVIIDVKKIVQWSKKVKSISVQDAECIAKYIVVDN